MLYFWIHRIKKDASFVFIDEFDAFYHFELSYEVCRRLFGLDCQVFTSSHNTYLMTNDLLRPDCNFILNENKVKALCDCTDKELRLGLGLREYTDVVTGKKSSQFGPSYTMVKDGDRRADANEPLEPNVNTNSSATLSDASAKGQ